MHSIRIDIHRIDIHRSFDDLDPVYLGTVNVLADLEEQRVHDLLDELWEAFSQSEPDSDGQFVDFVIDQRPDLFERAEENQPHYVG